VYLKENNDSTERTIMIDDIRMQTKNEINERTTMNDDRRTNKKDRNKLIPGTVYKSRRSKE
jgi:hypothetical protein